MSRQESPKRAGLLAKLNVAGQQVAESTIMFHQTVAERLGLNLTDYRCVMLLSMNESLTAGELANFTGLTSGAITAVIDRLERAGLVRRDDDPKDRRRVIVRAVTKRLKQIALLFEPFAATFADVCRAYTDEELAAILGFVSRTHESLHELALKLREQSHSAGKRKH